MTRDEMETRLRIDALVDSMRHDRCRSNQLFQYVWTMVCVRRGLLRVLREVSQNGTVDVIVEEARSGRQRTVVRPPGLDPEIESLAVQALTRILEH